VDVGTRSGYPVGKTTPSMVTGVAADLFFSLVRPATPLRGTAGTLAAASMIQHPQMGRSCDGLMVEEPQADCNTVYPELVLRSFVTGEGTLYICPGTKESLILRRSKPSPPDWAMLVTTSADDAARPRSSDCSKMLTSPYRLTFHSRCGGQEALRGAPVSARPPTSLRTLQRCGVSRCMATCVALFRVFRCHGVRQAIVVILQIAQVALDLRGSPNAWTDACQQLPVAAVCAGRMRRGIVGSGRRFWTPSSPLAEILPVLLSAIACDNMKSINHSTLSNRK
jgi:hypothetical protein